MKSARIDVFFSCSFRQNDKEVNDYFAAICSALDMQLTNVKNGSSRNPPEVAKSQIQSAQALIAICVKRDEMKSGSFIMPAAVYDEISFAFGINTPVLLIVEEGVETEGFKKNFGTIQFFCRDDLKKTEFLEKSIKSIHELKMDVISDHQIGLSGGISESHAEYVNHLVELNKNDDSFTWNYSTTKKLIYTNSSNRSFTTGSWATVPSSIPEDALNMQWNLDFVKSSRDIDLKYIIERQTPECVEVLLRPEPNPEAGDWIEYSTSISSEYINPIWQDQIQKGSIFHLNDQDYQCIDGLTFLHRTKKAIIEFRFCKEYGLSKNEIRPFVGAYTSGIDFEVESELKRAVLKIENFGGNLIVRMEIDSLLQGHMYGIAWNPKIRRMISLDC